MTVSDANRTTETQSKQLTVRGAGQRVPVPAESRESLGTEGVSLAFKLVKSEVISELNTQKRDEPAACTVASISSMTGSREQGGPSPRGG
eukprot:scaffold22003_cov207-Isochrysis_galbana.AAC.2